MKAAWIALALCGAAHAQDMGKLTATGGVSQAEGAGGGGLVPWALITGYGTRDSWGANAHATLVRTQDYALDTAGVAVGVADRFEVSLARQEFRGSLAPLDRLRIRQDIAAVKLRVAGDAVYGQDEALPQIAVGAMVKRNRGIDGLGALGVGKVTQLGAHSGNGVDYYVAATRIDLSRSLLWNATLRATRANQLGILGFGGERGGSYRAQLELSGAYLVNRRLVAGAEYRMKPANLAVDPEQDAWDVFVAWFPSKRWSLTAAYVSLGRITVFNPARQHGLYLSAQAGF
ncbi:MAG TPA: DUF3034 family protein [Telluria sp.]|nr:DUF3034 family protein [Telluria sp.]